MSRARSVRRLAARSATGACDADCTRVLTVTLPKLNASHALHTYDLHRARAKIALLCHGVEEACDDAEGSAANVNKLSCGMIRDD